MSTSEIYCEKSSSGLFVLVTLLVVGWFLVTGLAHAYEKHGIKAVVGDFITNQVGEPYHCRDKDYKIAPTGPEQWMVKVLNKAGETITVFDSKDGDYLERCLIFDGCDRKELPKWE